MRHLIYQKSGEFIIEQVLATLICYVKHIIFKRYFDYFNNNFTKTLLIVQAKHNCISQRQL